MITSVTCSADLRQAVNENFYGLLTGKRKIILAKEVNNTLGKLQADVKMEMMQNALMGNRNQISWFDRNVISLPAKQHLKVTNGHSNGNGKKKKAA